MSPRHHKIRGMASIEKRKNKDGHVTSWRVVWYHQGRKLSQTLDTEDAAQQWKSIIEAAAGDPVRAEAALLSTISDKPPFKEVAAAHIQRLVNVQQYTIVTYDRYVRLHLGALADMPTDRITEDDMIRWVRHMQDKGSSPKMIRNVHGFINSVFTSAVRRRIRDENPCSGHYLPDMGQTEDRAVFLTMDQFNYLMGFMPAHYRPFFGFLYGTGLRLSEAAALTPEDFTLDGIPPAVRVTKAWKKLGGAGFEIGPPKSKAGRRTVSLAPSTVELIRPLVENTKPGEPVFTMLRGGVIIPARIHSRVWQSGVKSALEAKGSPIKKAPRIHDLRHSHASVMIAGGANLFELAARLGHESVQTTTQVYGHLVPGAHFRTAQIAEQALGGGELEPVEE